MSSGTLQLAHKINQSFPNHFQTQETFSFPGQKLNNINFSKQSMGNKNHSEVWDNLEVLKQLKLALEGTLHL